MKKILQKLIFPFLLILSITSYAQNSQDFGQYVIHYNAITTDFLPKDIAKENGIKRSKNQGMVNITILKKLLNTPSKPTVATVQGSAVNLSKQLQTLEIKQIKEGNAIYYISQFRVNNTETLDFTFHVKPEGDSESYTVKFRHKFYTK